MSPYRFDSYRVATASNFLNSTALNSADISSQTNVVYLNLKKPLTQWLITKFCVSSGITDSLWMWIHAYNIFVK